MPIAPTLADGVSGNIEKTSITWALCRKFVDEVVVVEEDAIADAMRWAVEVPHTLLEGSAVLGIAALRAGGVDVTDRNLAIVTTGRNLGPETLRALVT
jgi:threonine dehydratase